MGLFREVRQRQNYVFIVEQIGEAVKTEKLRLGDKLPTEQDLADTFNVSRASVREALSALKLIGLVKSQAGAGHFISCLDDRNTFLEQVTELMYFLKEMDPFEILEARLQLEGSIAALAALNRTDGDLVRMKRLLNEMLVDAEEGRTSMELDSEFHQLIAKSTQNTILMEMLEDLHSRMKAKSWRVFKEQSLRNSKRLTYQQEHARIFRAIEAGDSDGARDAMIGHIETIHENFLGDESDMEGKKGGE